MLYVAWETEAPKGFALNIAPQFFYLKANRVANSVKDQQAMADFADVNDLGPWDANFKVEDPQTEFGFLKVDGTVATPGSYTDPNIPGAQPKPTYVVRDSAYLAGSESAFGLAFIAAGMVLAVIAQKNRRSGVHAAPRNG